MKGMVSACATVTTACPSYPLHQRAVTIALGPAARCRWWYGLRSNHGHRQASSADQATLSQTYTNTQVASAGKALRSPALAQISASRSGNILTVKCSGAAAAGASGGAGGGRCQL